MKNMMVLYEVYIFIVHNLYLYREEMIIKSRQTTNIHNIHTHTQIYTHNTTNHTNLCYYLHILMIIIIIIINILIIIMIIVMIIIAISISIIVIAVSPYKTVCFRYYMHDFFIIFVFSAALLLLLTLENNAECLPFATIIN